MQTDSVGDLASFLAAQGRLERERRVTQLTGGVFGLMFAEYVATYHCEPSNVQVLLLGLGLAAVRSGK